MRTPTILAGLLFLLAGPLPARADTYWDVAPASADAVVKKLEPGTVVVQFWPFAENLYRISVVQKACVEDGTYAADEGRKSVAMARTLLFFGHSRSSEKLQLEEGQKGCGGPFSEPFTGASDDSPNFNALGWEYVDLPYTYRSQASVTHSPNGKPLEFTWICSGACKEEEEDASPPPAISAADLARITSCASSSLSSATRIDSCNAVGRLARVKVVAAAAILTQAAAIATPILKNGGFRVGEVANADEARKKSVVYFGTGQEAAARKVAALLPGGATVEPLTWKTPFDLIVALGSSVLPPAR